MESITSKNNDKIKLAIQLKDSASARKKTSSFFVEGARLCYDAAVSNVDILQFFFTPKAKEKFSDFYCEISAKADSVFEINEEVSKKMSDTQSPQGMFCVCKTVDKIAEADKINIRGKYILLENIQDPSNLGAISRTAEALGIDGMIVSGGCDIYNPKALRASMGAFFRLNVINCDDLQKFISQAKALGMTVAASTPSKDAEIITDVDFSGGVISIVGNEGNGVSRETMENASIRITIPMGGRAESLNAGTAAAIIIWEMMRHGS
ncbi:MAG: RNA methyltransferase [Clostridia bacterium]|nr:RNA methyltransferase [Clostridia bacterium]